MKNLTGRDVILAHYENEHALLADLNSIIRQMEMIGSNCENQHNFLNYIRNYIEVLKDEKELRTLYIKLLMEKMKYTAMLNIGNVNS